MSVPRYASELSDQRSDRQVLDSSVVYEGRIWNVVSDDFLLKVGQEPLTRDYLRHPGAVAVVVLNEDRQILLIRQYRHPVRMNLWEIPAGLLDVEGEDYRSAAERELAEEADLAAADWRVLTDMFTTPGSSSEAIRIYLARSLTDVPEGKRHTRTHEESEIEFAWIGISDAVEAVLSGRIHNPSAVAGILAASAASASDFVSLRGPDAPWPEQHQLKQHWS